VSTPDYYAAAWAFFKALEQYRVDHPEDDDVPIAIVEEFGEDAILRGLALVAAEIRSELRQHAQHVGCDCGSDQWLDDWVLKAATDVGPEDTDP
jgi:hypothetical protein